MRKRNILDDLKFLIRATEGTLEIGLLTIVFYGAWKLGYWGVSFPEDFGGTSLYLLLGVYALFAPGASTALMMRIAGIMLAFSGVVNMIAAFALTKQ